VFTPIYGSPFLCTVSSARTSAAESDVEGAGIVGGVAGTVHRFVITARDVLGNLRGVTGDAWQVCACGCRCRLPGSGSQCVCLGNGTLMYAFAGLSFITLATHPAVGFSCSACCAPLTACVCQILAVLSAQGIGVEASCVDPFANGTYSCSYVPVVAGSYLLAITLDRVHVENSPYNVIVTVAPTNGARCVATEIQSLVRGCAQLWSACAGAGAERGCRTSDCGLWPCRVYRVAVVQVASVNQAATFLVHIRDSFDNPRTVNDVASLSITVNGDPHSSTFVYAGGDTYRVTFTPTFAGVITVRVLVAGDEIFGSPFRPVVL
jgi:hypothetical protein